MDPRSPTNFDKISSTPRTKESESRGEAIAPATAETRNRITVNLRPEAVYDFCRELRNLPLFMKELDEEWTAEVTGEIPNREISWRGLEGGRMAVSGKLQFTTAPGGRGTVVSLLTDYSLPGGKPREIVESLFGHDPRTLAQVNLRRLKALLETGEIPDVVGDRNSTQIAGRHCIDLADIVSIGE